MRLFVIDWTKESTTPLIEYCKKSGHKVVGCELKDGGEAYKKTATCKADIIIINYAEKPSHGRITAQQIRARKSTAEIPLYFIDGNEEDNEKVAHLGVCLSAEELRDLLEDRE